MKGTSFKGKGETAIQRQNKLKYKKGLALLVDPEGQEFYSLLWYLRCSM